MINDSFLLNSKVAISLYEQVKDLPIVDYHNHLNPKEIYENIPFSNISDMWLKHDHYKWRLMRFSGIKEENISSGNPLTLFKNYVSALEKAYLNPLYHWSHMELKTFFKIDEILTVDSAEKIYHKANKYLILNPKGPMDLLKELRVESLCTTDDINDNLEYHDLLNKDSRYPIKVFPTFRPDKLFAFDNAIFVKTIKKLESIINISISDLDSLEKALMLRLDYFNNKSCKLADHGITHFVYHGITSREASMIYSKKIKKENISSIEQEMLNSYLLSFFLKEYGKRNWTVQYHIGALRDNNTLGYNKLGKDSGYDSISSHNFVDDFNKFLNQTHLQFGLPRIIIYPLNSGLYEAVATLCANFSENIPGKIQLGAAWWFNDNLTGIKKQLSVFAEHLNINNFIGMVTDSRSFLSFTRHDYFRRILANFIGEKVEEGLIPRDMNRLIQLVQNIAYYNAKNYLDFSS